jgi:hypothetical protein
MFDIIPYENSIIGGIEIVATSKHGFHVCLTNGYKVSVQWGGGLYADNYHSRDYSNVSMKSTTAEVGVFNPAGDLIETPFSDGDVVAGWQTPEQVLETIEWAKTQVPDSEKLAGTDSLEVCDE